MVIFYEETKTFLQIKQQELILSLMETTLPIVFNRDLALIQHPIRLHSSKDLAKIAELTQDRKYWRGLTSRIEKSAEVSQINGNKPVSNSIRHTTPYLLLCTNFQEHTTNNTTTTTRRWGKLDQRYSLQYMKS